MFTRFFGHEQCEPGIRTPSTAVCTAFDDVMM